MNLRRWSTMLALPGVYEVRCRFTHIPSGGATKKRQRSVSAFESMVERMVSETVAPACR